MSDLDIRNEVVSGVIRRSTNQFIEIEDWTKGIAELNPEDNIFYYLSTRGEGKLESTMNRRFNWIEYEEPVQMIDLAGRSGTVGTGGLVTLGAGVKVHGLVPDMILRSMTADANGDYNYFRCTSRPTDVVAGGVRTYSFRLNKFNPPNADEMSTGEVPVVIGDLPATDKLIFMYVSRPAGTDVIHPIKRLVDDKWNTVTTLEYHTEIDLHKAAESWRGDLTLREWNNKQMARQASEDIERFLLLGRGYDGYQVAGDHVGNDLQATRGFMNFRNIQKYSGTATAASITYDNWLEWVAYGIKKYNRNQFFTGLCNDNFLMMIDRMVRRTPNVHMTIDMNGKTDKYGLNVKQLVTPFGTVNARVSKCLNEQFPNEAVLLTTDMSKIRIRFLAGNGENFAIALHKDVQGRNAKKHVDNLYGGMGLQLENAEMHSMFKIPLGA